MGTPILFQNSSSQFLFQKNYLVILAVLICDASLLGNESTFASQNLDVARNVQSDERQLYSQATSSLTVSHKNNFKDTQELKVTSQIKRTPQDSINPLSPNIQKQILQTDLYTFPYRISWEKLIKDQRFFSL